MQIYVWCSDPEPNDQCEGEPKRGGDGDPTEIPHVGARGTEPKGKEDHQALEGPETDLHPQEEVERTRGEEGAGEGRDTEDDPDGKWLRINTDYAKIWPNITVKGEPPADAEAFEREVGKFEKYFSEKPGRGS